MLVTMLNQFGWVKNFRWKGFAAESLAPLSCILKSTVASEWLNDVLVSNCIHSWAFQDHSDPRNSEMSFESALWSCPFLFMLELLFLCNYLNHECFLLLFTLCFHFTAFKNIFKILPGTNMITSRLILWLWRRCPIWALVRVPAVPHPI